MKKRILFIMGLIALSIWWTTGESDAYKAMMPRGNSATIDTAQVDTGDHFEAAHAHIDTLTIDEATLLHATFTPGYSSNFSYINADTINVDTITINVNGKVGFLTGVHIVFDDGSSANISKAILDTLIIGVYDPQEALRPVSATTDWGFITYVDGAPSAYDTLMISPGQNSAGLFNSILMGTVNTTNNDADGTWGHVFEIVGKDINLGFRGRVGPAGGFNGKLNVGYDDIDIGLSHKQGIGSAGSGYTRMIAHGLSADQTLFRLQSEYTGSNYNTLDMYEAAGSAGGGMLLGVFDVTQTNIQPGIFITDNARTIINDPNHSAGYVWTDGTGYDQTLSDMGDSTLTDLGGLDVKGGALFTGDILSVYGDATSASGLQVDAGAAHADTVILSATTTGACVGCSEPPLALKTSGLTRATIDASGNMGVGVLPAKKFEIGSADNSNRVSITHDNTDAYFYTDDGDFIFLTDEGVNTDGIIAIKGKGTGAGRLRIYDEDNAEYFEFYSVGGAGFFRMAGSSPGQLNIQNTAEANATFFLNATEGETREITIQGFRTGDASRQMQIGSSVDVANAASFDGVSNYLFDGKVNINSLTAPTAVLTVSSGGSSAINAGGAVLIDVDGTIGTSDADLTVQNGATWSRYNAGDADWATSSDSTLKENLHTAGNGKIQHLWDIFASKDSIDVWAYNWKKSSLESPETIEHIWEDTTKIEERVQEVLKQDSTLVESAVRDSITTLVWAGIDAKLIADSLRIERAYTKKHVGLIAQQATRIERLLSGEDDPTRVNHERIQAASLLMIMEMARRIDDLQAQVDSLKTLHAQ